MDVEENNNKIVIRLDVMKMQMVTPVCNGDELNIFLFSNACVKNTMFATQL